MVLSAWHHCSGWLCARLQAHRRARKGSREGGVGGPLQQALCAKASVGGMDTTKDLLSTVLGLPSSERAHFARELIASLDDGADADAADAWVSEIERRVEGVVSGTAKVAPWTEARARITARLRNRRR